MLHFFGCSFTWGDEIDDRCGNRFSQQLSNLTNIPSHNYSVPGNDDFTSVVTFMRLYHNGYIKPGDYVFFQWTERWRFGMPVEDKILQYPFVETTQGGWDELDDKVQDAVKGIFPYINAVPMIDLNLILRQTFTAFTQNLDFDVYHYEMNTQNEEWPIPESWKWPSMSNYLNEKFVGEWALERGHPSIEAHSIWAQFLYDQVFSA